MKNKILAFVILFGTGSSFINANEENLHQEIQEDENTKLIKEMLSEKALNVLSQEDIRKLTKFMSDECVKNNDCYAILEKMYKQSK